MKNRRLVLVAFLLCASILVGVGYATVSGALSIGGTATFNGQDSISSVVQSSVKFTAATSEDAAVETLTFTTTTGTMDVVFNDAVGNEAEFGASATFTVSYENTDESATMPDVTFDIIASMDTIGNLTVDGWDINVVCKREGVTLEEDAITLAPGQSIDVIVTVTFDNTEATGDVFKNTTKANINVALEYLTVATTEL